MASEHQTNDSGDRAVEQVYAGGGGPAEQAVEQAVERESERVRRAVEKMEDEDEDEDMEEIDDENGNDYDHSYPQEHEEPEKPHGKEIRHKEGEEESRDDGARNQPTDSDGPGEDSQNAEPSTPDPYGPGGCEHYLFPVTWLHL